MTRYDETPVLQGFFQQLAKSLAKELAKELAPCLSRDMVSEMRRMGVSVQTDGDVLSKYGPTMTTKEVIEVLGCSEKTVWNMVGRGELSSPAIVRRKAQFQTEAVRKIVNQKPR